jgi:hypothetical protein
MRGCDREIAEHEPQPIPHLLLNRLDDRERLAAVGAFVVAVLHQGHRGVGGTFGVIAIAHRNRQARRGVSHAITCLPVSFSSAVRMPSAPGLTLVGVW